jgi:D-alanine-D-alanine ligase
MRVLAVLDIEIDFDVLASRIGPWSNWFDAYILDTVRSLGHHLELTHFVSDVSSFIAMIRAATPDVVLNLAQHVSYDRGKAFYIPALLELARVSYTGSPPQAMHSATDKALAKTILNSVGIRVPKFIVFPGAENEEFKSLPLPAIIKPRCRGGSEYLTRNSIVRSRSELRQAVKSEYDYIGEPLICEEFVPGRELTVGLFEAGTKLRACAPGEWVLPNHKGPEFVTERVKWDVAYQKKWGIQHRTARLSQTLRRTVQTVAKRAYKVLGVRDYGGVDLRLRPDGTLYVLEVNANPGLWPGSARYQGVPFEKLIASILQNALRRRPSGS